MSLKLSVPHLPVEAGLALSLLLRPFVGLATVTFTGAR